MFISSQRSEVKAERGLLFHRLKVVRVSSCSRRHLSSLRRSHLPRRTFAVQLEGQLADDATKPCSYTHAGPDAWWRQESQWEGEQVAMRMGATCWRSRADDNYDLMRVRRVAGNLRATGNGHGGPTVPEGTFANLPVCSVEVIKLRLMAQRAMPRQMLASQRTG